VTWILIFFPGQGLRNGDHDHNQWGKIGKNQISLAVIGHVCETASYKKMEEKEGKS
jgi:hypothetical protein